jgi:hypothetical protein
MYIHICICISIQIKGITKSVPVPISNSQISVSPGRRVTSTDTGSSLDIRMEQGKRMNPSPNKVTIESDRIQSESKASNVEGSKEVTENDKGSPLENEKKGRGLEYQKITASSSLKNDINQSRERNYDIVDEKLMISVEEDAPIDGMSDCSDDVYKAARYVYIYIHIYIYIMYIFICMCIYVS